MLKLYIIKRDGPAVRFYVLQDRPLSFNIGNHYTVMFRIMFPLAIPTLATIYILAFIGVVVCPITSGDTAFRSARLIIGETFKLDQKKLKNRLLIYIIKNSQEYFRSFYIKNDSKLLNFDINAGIHPDFINLLKCPI